jgi:acyl carrier protein
MTEEDARRLVVEALGNTANSFNNPAVSDRLRQGDGSIGLEELGLDSLDVVEWSVEIESRTGVILDPGELNAVDTLGDVVALVVKKSAG